MFIRDLIKPVMKIHCAPCRMSSLVNYHFRKYYYIISFSFILILLIGFLLYSSFSMWITNSQNGKEVQLSDTSNQTRALTENLDVSHIFVVSAYYYPFSKSLGQNALAVNMVIDSKNSHVNTEKHYFVGSNTTYSKTSVAVLESETIEVCRYGSAVALVTMIDNLTKLEIDMNGLKVEIPFKMARYNAPKPVIFCISPQFVAEQWEIFVFHVHVARRFGAHLIIYVTSIIDSYFELMQGYERIGYITLQKWLKMKFNKPETPFFEPNLNTELRNQAGAHTDCLLQYKEAAQFISFFDMDDILFPLNYPTYLQEFTHEFNKVPGARSIFYGRREHQFTRAGSFSHFNFHDIVKSLKSSLTKAPKPVIKPELYNSMGIHGSKRDRDPKRQEFTLTGGPLIKVPSIIHVQRPIGKEGPSDIHQLWKFEFGIFNETIREIDVEALDEDFLKVRNMPEFIGLDSRLPKTDYFFSIIFKCYLTEFYNQKLTKCPNADRCQIPQHEDYKCIHTDAKYVSSQSLEPFTYHFYTNEYWSKSYGCYQ